MTQDLGFAILASVPLEHLKSGKDVAAAQGFVAFGTKERKLFRRVDELRGGQRVPVLMYASHDGAPAKSQLHVSWFGWYVEHSDSIDGAHPLGMQHRPPSTSTSASDNQGYWEAFWHVACLRELPADQRVPIGDLQKVKGGFRANAAPRKPALVVMPDVLSMLK